MDWVVLEVEEVEVLVVVSSTSGASVRPCWRPYHLEEVVWAGVVEVSASAEVVVVGVEAAVFVSLVWVVSVLVSCWTLLMSEFQYELK